MSDTETKTKREIKKKNHQTKTSEKIYTRKHTHTHSKQEVKQVGVCTKQWVTGGVYGACVSEWGRVRVCVYDGNGKSNH